MNAKPNTKDPAQSPPARKSPVPSPEFAQARLRRDIRLLNERFVNLTETYEEKKAAIVAKIQEATKELAAVDEKLRGGA